MTSLKRVAFLYVCLVSSDARSLPTQRDESAAPDEPWISIEAANRSFPAGEMPSLIVTFLNPTNGDVCFETDTALNRTVMRENLHFDLSWTPLRLHKGIQDRIANPPLSIRGMYAPTFAAAHGKAQAVISGNSLFSARFRPFRLIPHAVHAVLLLRFDGSGDRRQRIPSSKDQGSSLAEWGIQRRDSIRGRGLTRREFLYCGDSGVLYTYSARSLAASRSRVSFASTVTRAAAMPFAISSTRARASFVRACSNTVSARNRRRSSPRGGALSGSIARSDSRRVRSSAPVAVFSDSSTNGRPTSPRSSTFFIAASRRRYSGESSSANRRFAAAASGTVAGFTRSSSNFTAGPGSSCSR